MMSADLGRNPFGQVEVPFGVELCDIRLLVPEARLCRLEAKLLADFGGGGVP